MGENWDAMRVHLHHNREAPQTGIYRCGIPSEAVHDGTDTSVRDTVYVGLHTARVGNGTC